VSFVGRVKSGLIKALGGYASGSTFVPPASWPAGWWQGGYRFPRNDGNAAVEACVGVISQTIASLPLQHWRTTANGGQELVANSPVTRVLRRPNLYQTRSDFILNLVRMELLSGNGIAVAGRSEDRKVESLHLLPSNHGVPYVAPGGEVFYRATARSEMLPDPVVGEFFPARDVLHVRMHTPRHPLIGESPIMAAALSIQAGNAISEHTTAFFENMTRPSGYLTSPKMLKPEVASQLRSEWERAYSRENSGKIAVLLDGLEWKPLSINSVDAQLIESYKLTVADVARVFRVPLAVIGELGGATLNNTETLIRHWLSTGLGFMIEHIELAFDVLFELPEGEFVAFDVEYLLRADFAARMDGLVKAVQGGVYSPNEARRKENLPSVAHGDEPRVQAQVVPLSAAGMAPSAPSAPSAPAPPAPSKAAKPKSAAEYLTLLRSMQNAA
jgi:HK97 family phage portal protein